MKIAEITPVFPPYVGGMGSVCFYNARELARRGHDVTVFTLDYGLSNYQNDPEDFEVIRLKTPLMYGNAGVVPQLYRKLKHFDMLHLHYPFFGGAEYVYMASVLRGQPYFLTYHMDVSGDTFLKKILIAAYEALFMKKIVRGAARIGALSIGHLKSAKVAKIVNWQRVVEMPNGIDTSKFCQRHKDPVLLERYGLKDKTVVIFVGHFKPFKGLNLLIETIGKIGDKNTVLLVVGGGYVDESVYRTKAREFGIEDRVIFVGKKSSEKDLSYYYNLGDFLVLPSTQESFSLVIVEAMASGIPAIAFSLPGPAGLIDDGKDGFIVRMGDAESIRSKMEYLINRKGEREKMGMRARKKVEEKYSLEKVGERLEKVFEDMRDEIS